MRWLKAGGDLLGINSVKAPPESSFPVSCYDPIGPEAFLFQQTALLKSHFSHVTMLGQRIVYGSALMLEGSPGAVQSWGVDQEESVSGLHAPMYKVAIASDNPSWGEMACSGILEDSVYRSEAIIERTENAHRAAAEQGRLAEEASWKLKRAQADLEYQTQRAQELQEEVKKLWRKWYGSWHGLA